MNNSVGVAPVAAVKIGLALLLIGLQAIVVIAGFCWPNANPAYRATYITHSMDCWLPPGAPAFLPSADVIRPLALSPYQACALLPKGWNAGDASAVWSNGRIAELNIPLRPGDARVTLRLRGYSQILPQAVEILRSDAPPLSLTISPNTIASVTMAVMPGTSMLRLRIEIAHVHHPMDRDLMDWRAIGVALLDITRTPQSALPDGTPSK